MPSRYVYACPLGAYQTLALCVVVRAARFTAAYSRITRRFCSFLVWAPNLTGLRAVFRSSSASLMDWSSCSGGPLNSPFFVAHHARPVYFLAGRIKVVPLWVCHAVFFSLKRMLAGRRPHNQAINGRPNAWRIWPRADSEVEAPHIRRVMAKSLYAC